MLSKILHILHISNQITDPNGLVSRVYMYILEHELTKYKLTFGSEADDAVRVLKVGVLQTG